MQAAAGLNVTLKAILNPGEEVIVLAPFFVEYGTYIEHANGKTVVVNTKKDSFQIDVKAVEDAITEKTKAIIINSPNNPTGVIYSRESLESLNQAIERKEAELGISIFVISDEPYISLVYDGAEVPNIQFLKRVFKSTPLVNPCSSGRKNRIYSCKQQYSRGRNPYFCHGHPEQNIRICQRSFSVPEGYCR